MPQIDLNADLGEGAGADALAGDEAILESVSSANVACGFHAGDAATMRAVCAAAVARGVSIGAHVGYDDRPGFGRRELDVDADLLRDETVYQLGALAACAAVAGGRVAYVKPHGALYSRCIADPAAAAAIAAAAAAVDRRLALLGPPGSELLAAAAASGLEPVAEGFADRAYRSDGRLVARTEPGSLLGRAAAVAQAEEIATGRAVVAADGRRISLTVASLCLHSDTPGAAELARALRARLEALGIQIRAFAP
jgi:UPF0271 protein